MALAYEEAVENPEPAPESERGAIDGLRSRMPIGPSLPALYHGDDFCQRLTMVFDDALSPVVTTLDCFPAYLDPALAPEDFVAWLAGWVAVSLDEAWSPDQRRRLVAKAVEIYRHRGTVEAMSMAIRLYTGADPEITDSGGCSWSSRANSALPGGSTPWLKVRVTVARAGQVDARVVEGIVRENKPAHLPHRVEIVEPDRP